VVISRRGHDHYVDRQRVRVDGRQLTVSNLEKVLFPEVSFTKAQVIDYYVRIAPVLLPHLSGRPVTFTRWPDGVEGQAFFEKNSARHAPDWVRRVTIPSPGSSTGRETLEMVILETVADLAWAANLAALELHVPQWQVGSKLQPALPDLLVLDLDPGPEAGIRECCAVADRLGRRLVDDGLDPVVKTSGSKGMQVYAPISVRDRDHPSRYAKRLAQELAAQTPDEVVWRMEKVLRPGKVLVDWSQNNPAKTTVAPYSMRARPDATVSTPIGWDEVEAVLRGADPGSLRFRTDDVLDRVAEYGDLFDVAHAVRARLPDA
jgi:bifunctional non-homologous end joining protein LigD